RLLAAPDHRIEVRDGHVEVVTLDGEAEGVLAGAAGDLVGTAERAAHEVVTGARVYGVIAQTQADSVLAVERIDDAATHGGLQLIVVIRAGDVLDVEQLIALRPAAPLVHPVEVHVYPRGRAAVIDRVVATVAIDGLV